jgi:hypothetical protein
MAENTAFAHWSENYRRPADDVRELREALASGEFDFAEFEMA